MFSNKINRLGPLGIRNSSHKYPGVRNFSIDHNAIINTMTSSFQTVHEFSGLPWWALIPLTTFTLRSVWTLPWQYKENEFKTKSITSAKLVQ